MGSDTICWDVVRKTIKIFTLNIAVLVIGVVLLYSNTSVYIGAV
jgi:hypothetical protein